MFERKTSFSTTARAAVFAAVAAVTLTSFAPTSVMAAPAASGATANHGTSGATDFSSARRRHYRGNGNAAGLAAFGAIVGTIGAIAASQNRRDRYYDNGYYGNGYGGHGYYGGGPAYYGGGPAYYGGPGYY